MFRQCKTPVDPALAALCRLPASRAAVLLHSGRYHSRWASRSILATPVSWFRAWPDGRTEIVGEALGVEIKFDHHPWRDLRRLLNHPDLPDRWIGYFSYDLAHQIEPAKLPRTRPPGPWPLIELAYCPMASEFPAPQAPAQAQVQAKQNDAWGSSGARGLTADFTPAQYQSAVARVIDYISQGDVFQVNLAQRFTAQYLGSPRDLYLKLAHNSPAWYGSLLELPDHRAILSTSPELFLEMIDRRVITRPIKGTRPATGEIDQQAHDLLRSQKDTAELNMIVDLMRNDLGRVCEYGSVKVDEPRTIETHPTIHHGVATISGQLHQRFDIVDLLKATLPGGSITGAPKVRAMQIIDELEPVARGPYCGAIGWITREACQLNIAIRTMLLRSSAHEACEVSFSVGGGIVADSDPKSEYEETLDKARAIIQALSAKPI